MLKVKWKPSEYQIFGGVFPVRSFFGLIFSFLHQHFRLTREEKDRTRSEVNAADQFLMTGWAAVMAGLYVT